MLLVALFGFVEIHELFPLFHWNPVPGDINAPNDFCPFCVIKYALLVALWLFPVLMLQAWRITAVYRPRFIFSPSHCPTSSSSRAPPAALFFYR